MPFLTVILPVYNEQDNLHEMNRQLQAVLATQAYDVEIYYVDDGSQDKSAAIISEFALTNSIPTQAIIFRRNFGQTAAIAAGIDHARGEIIILMDSDLQNDPTDIPMLVEKMQEGYDVISGWRKKRDDKWSRRIPSQFANRLISTVTGVHLHDYGCTLKAYRTEVIRDVHLYGEMHRFIPVYAHSVGAKITEMVVHHHPRTAGKSKYGIWRTFKVILDLMTVQFLSGYGTRPMYIFGGIGLVMLVVSALLIVSAVVYALLTDTSILQTRLLTLSATIGAFSVQSILLGLTTELVMRTYYESQHKAIYTIRRIVESGTDQQVPLVRPVPEAQVLP
jgi:glycosyltransferase involved in cell wall biosynthesis